MKSKLKCIIFIFFSLLITSIINENNNCIFAAENKPCSENDCSVDENKKIIYLTFDDGPSYKVTNKVLDILKDNEVNATFFLIGNQIEGKEDVVKRIYDEGNSIGLHTYTHNFRRIYCDEDKFIQEMIDCRSEIQKVVGISPNIIRFPGGSCKHLSKSYLNKLHENDFRVYDWDLDNCDGLNPQDSPYNLYRKAIKGSDKMNNIILLMHCTDMNRNTCQALPKIIKFYKNSGYEFKTITEDTAELYFPLKNK
ncbi:polysaccharide deacetylase [Clostridium chromiireducens]|uniref:Peptidoglycan-N-acetylglucosamine deacetylase n=1 Tax=Clostridium chromiireducens TaxID=225345 RepID=A0A1V4ITT7_9CLOT|nr:polysaccharide deacetylase family protein [Clostridium chromiireducens]OPJ63329.1 peptidoglycan-N-acetylglucosamine deacetylase [Clostridium chromiireducens]RII33809.1 polysaccharide deacetylase [Clostridium chromiireducens]